MRLYTAAMRSLTVVLLAVLLSACSSSADDGGDATTTSESSSAAASPSSSTATEEVDATQLAEELKNSSKTATKVLTITEDNDPNNLIGYDSAAVIYDAGGSCDEPMTDCGLVIEVFSDEASAKSRGEYIQAILKGSPALGSEWDYVKGNALLRVSGKLSPSTNTTYADAFGGEEVSVAAK